ncbi:hypothetical protein [Parageobacillus thermoglucosidasius]|uniref:hypothetical protein n=1 Tax=Parageobacillus thermoglucosidasius TaxID=1426 RepID=UPI0035DEEAC7
MLTGKLLGDGNITIQKNRKPRFRFGHSIKDRDWCVHCYQKLADFLPLNPPKYRRVIDSRIKGGFFLNYIMFNPKLTLFLSISKRFGTTIQ